MAEHDGINSFAIKRFAPCVLRTPIHALCVFLCKAQTAAGSIAEDFNPSCEKLVCPKSAMHSIHRSDASIRHLRGAMHLAGYAKVKEAFTMAKTKTAEPIPDYEEVAQQASKAIRQALGESVKIATRRNYYGRVQMDVVSPLLNCMNEREKQNFLWDILDSALHDRTKHISIVLGYGTNEYYPDIENPPAYRESPTSTHGSNGHVSGEAVNTTEYDYREIAPRVKAALHRAFGENTTIVTSEGYSGRLHVKVVSERFNGMRESEKQQYARDAIHDELDPETQEAVSLVMCYATDEL